MTQKQKSSRFLVLNQKSISTRPTPLQEEFGIFGVKVISSMPQGFDLGKEAMIQAQHAKGQVLVGSMDNNLYFASPKDSLRFYEAIGIDQSINQDMGLIERAGTILKKQSGFKSFIPLKYFYYNKTNPNFFHTDDEHDGLIVRAPGVGLAQGVAIRKIGDPDTGQVSYQVWKGMLRSLLRDMDYDLTAAGKLVNPRVLRSERPSLNTSLQFKKERGWRVAGSVAPTHSSSRRSWATATICWWASGRSRSAVRMGASWERRTVRERRRDQRRTARCRALRPDQRTRPYLRMIQTDAAINEGNSRAARS